MNLEEKIDYVKTACSLVGVDISESDLEKIIRIHELVLEKGGEIGIQDLVKIKDAGSLKVNQFAKSYKYEDAPF